MLYHIIDRTDWEQAQKNGFWHAPSLDTEGFVHLSEVNQFVRVANNLYRGKPNLVVLEIDPARLSDPIIYEDLYNGNEDFPHLYGELPVTVVDAVYPFPAHPQGTFSPPRLVPPSHRELAVEFLELTLENVRRVYPNGLAHFLFDESDARKTPRQLHPAFYGCLDWHSAVHSHWQLVRALRFFPTMSIANEIRAVLNEHLTVENLQVEYEYIEKRKSFERPYGLAWFLLLCAELREWGAEEANGWLGVLAELEGLIFGRIANWLPNMPFPMRTGTHNQTAFSLGLIFDAAKIAGNTLLCKTIIDNAHRFYLDDNDAPLAYEPSGHDFLSPALGEADLMRRVLPTDEFRQWLAAFLPHFDLPPVTVHDEEDGHLAHFAGLNLSRAWMLEKIAASLPNGPSQRSLLKSAEMHRVAGLPYATNSAYMLSHWVPTFALYLVTHR